MLLIKAVLRGDRLASVAEAFEVISSRPHGTVKGISDTMARLGLATLLGPPCPQRDRVLAMIAARILAPHTKLGGPDA